MSASGTASIYIEFYGNTEDSHVQQIKDWIRLLNDTNDNINILASSTHSMGIEIDSNSVDDLYAQLDSFQEYLRSLEFVKVFDAEVSISGDCYRFDKEHE